MSDPLALVRTRLLAVAAVTTLVSTRVYTGRLPQNLTSLPAVLVRLIDRVSGSHLRGDSGLSVARVQLHHVASNREDALEVANAVEGAGDGSALSHYSGTVGSGRIAVALPGGIDREEYHAGELLQYEVIRDYLVHFA